MYKRRLIRPTYLHYSTGDLALSAENRSSANAYLEDPSFLNSSRSSGDVTFMLERGCDVHARKRVNPRDLLVVDSLFARGRKLFLLSCERGRE